MSLELRRSFQNVTRVQILDISQLKNLVFVPSFLSGKSQREEGGGLDFTQQNAFEHILKSMILQSYLRRKSIFNSFFIDFGFYTMDSLYLIGEKQRGYLILFGFFRV